jgi:NADPH2:quinone reductase
MTALLSKAAGGGDSLVLEDVPRPSAQPGGVVLAVKACGLNYSDVLLINDLHQVKPERPFSPGGEVAGVVKAVGEGVTHVKVGDRMMGNTLWGGMAEELALEASRLILMPDSMTFDTAAAFGIAYGAARYALQDCGHLKPGETVLVLGAAGGLGLAAVELSKAMGARVIAAASAAQKVALAKAHGADVGVVYPTGPFNVDSRRELAGLFKKVCGARGVDVVFDPVGGDYAEAALRSIAWRGRFLVLGFTAGIARIPLNLALLKGGSIIGVLWNALMLDPRDHAHDVSTLLDLYAAGKIRPHICARFPLTRAGEAIRLLAERNAMGKVVVTIN